MKRAILAVALSGFSALASATTFNAECADCNPPLGIGYSKNHHALYNMGLAANWPNGATIQLCRAGTGAHTTANCARYKKDSQSNYSFVAPGPFPTGGSGAGSGYYYFFNNQVYYGSSGDCVSGCVGYVEVGQIER